MQILRNQLTEFGLRAFRRLYDFLNVRRLQVVRGTKIGHNRQRQYFHTAVNRNEDFGHLVGNVGQPAEDYFYYSAVTYTSLGFGDVIPVGPLRLLSAIEALTGLVLIAWTASFAFFLMQRLWQDRAAGADKTHAR